MKIGYVHPYLVSYGGEEVRLHYLANELSSRGHDVSVIAQRYHGRFKPRDQCYKIVEVGQSLPEINRVMIGHFMLNVAQKLNNYDIIDITAPYSNVVARLFKISHITDRHTKIVSTVHEIFGLSGFFQTKSILSLFTPLLERMNLFLPYDAIVTVSNSSKNEIVRTGIDSSLISVIPNGVDPEFYRSMQVEKYSKPTVACVSRLHTKKSLDILIEMLFYLRNVIPDVQLILMGYGPDRSRLERMVSDLNLGESVKLTGYVSDEEKARILKSSHVFAFSSTQEGFGLAPLEGMACGLPVVASDIPAIREVFGDSVLYAKSPQEFCEQASELLTNSDSHQRMVRKSEEKVQEYSWKNCASQIERLYENLLEN